MSSLEQRYAEVITVARRLGLDPDPAWVEELREELDRLDHELQTSIVDEERRAALMLASREAAALLTAAAARARGVPDIERARQAADLLNRAASSTRNPLAERGSEDVLNRARGYYRGYGMER